MAFRFSERHVEEWYHQGITVFRGIIPTALVADLRRSADQGRPIAREKGGKQAQRLQPVGNYGDRIDLKPFRDYSELPELIDALHRVLSPQHRLTGLERTGVLFEPAEQPWCTAWHRDITEKSDGVDPQEFREVSKDPCFFAQVNCALYSDISTCYVPASALRPNLSTEIEAAKLPDLHDRTSEERERICHDYCEAMPGAVQLVLEPGDFALYGPNGWHIGNYAPYRKRATIHDGVWNDAAQAWHYRWTAKQEELRKAAAV
jgi:hypothetical protein